ncbi:MAG: phosphomannose isomerase type II C-terminal cupin domain [Candidatus Paceibacterota bacterium]|jgi:mannose-6-phosphate isomerase-like protein (cupin superfamily)
MQSPKTYREKRPWGEFIEFTRNSRSTVKILIVNPHEAFSLQKHKNRDEFWYVISGTGTVTVGHEVTAVSPGENYFIPKDTNHRVEAGNEQLNILEISFGDFDEGDITRIEDRYGRIK